MNKILIVDALETCLMLARSLGKRGFTTFQYHTGKSALEFLKTTEVDMVFCDCRLSDMTGRDFFLRLKVVREDLPIVFLSDVNDARLSVDLMKMGAADFLLKPLVFDEIEKAIKDIHKDAIVRNIDKGELKTESGPHFFMGTSSYSEDLMWRIEKVAPTNFTTIIYGESGSGKEMVAHKIHQKSSRAGKPFVAIDCGALSRELAGSELFGHEKGSFTGALNQKIGSFELANGGTIFLDEIANLSYDIQVSLLRAVQERKIRRIGGVKEIDIDVRIIVASNVNLLKACKTAGFREDLYHRFNEFKINLLPLRERRDDIILFAYYFLNGIAKDLGVDGLKLTEEVKNIFLQYPWPGNLRELQNVLKSCALLADGEVIGKELLPMELIQIQDTAVDGELDVVEPAESEQQSSSLENENSLRALNQDAEKKAILKVLKLANYNKSKAAQLLDIDRKTLYTKLKRINMGL
jgi:two-component system, NtrC family, response regulator HydG